MSKRANVHRDPQFWLVGAKERGEIETLPAFIKGQYWKLWWTDKRQPGMAALRDQIQPGDGIAIKRMRGPGLKGIRILASGTVMQGTHGKDKRVSVKWHVVGIDKIVDSHGCFSAISRPYSADDPWIREIFQL